MLHTMSEKKQRAARERREAALEREERARERAERQRELGDEYVARIHERSADAQHQAAVAAEDVRVADIGIEGDRLGEGTAHRVDDHS